jgi:hypothetical protein
LNYYLSQGDFIALGRIRIRDPDPDPEPDPDPVFFQRSDPDPDPVKMDRIRQHWYPEHLIDLCLKMEEDSEDDPHGHITSLAVKRSHRR